MTYPSKAAFALLTLVLMCGAHIGLLANPISPNRAKSIASKYIQVSPSPKKAKGATSANAPYYIYEGVNGRGFVIVSADDALGEVLAYSQESRLDTSAANGASLFLQCYAEDYEAYRNGELPAGQPAKVRHFTSKIGPLLKTVWDQNQPYNGMLPNHYFYTGCGPTAMAQIMYFHKWPARGKGSNTYVNNDDGATLYANFEESEYDYDNMLTKYSYVEDPVHNDAVALLMRDCGIASSTAYTKNWSGAYEWQLCDAFNNHFDYTASLFYRANEGSQRFYDMIVAEIAAGFPVMMAGGEGSSGHVFVADGVNESGNVHFNFGWSGQMDGYYQLPYNWFRKNANAVLAHPNKPDSKPLPAAWMAGAPRIQFNGTGIFQIQDVEPNTAVQRADTITLRLSEFVNRGKPFRGDMGVAIVDEHGSTINCFGSTEYGKGGFTSRLFNDTLITDGAIVNGNEVIVKAGIKQLKNGYYTLKAVCAPYVASAQSCGDWYDAVAYPQLEIEVAGHSLRVSKQGGYGRGWQLGGEPEWSQERIMPGDEVELTLPIDNLKGIQNDGTLIVNLLDSDDGNSYYLGNAVVSIDKYYSDSVTVSCKIPSSCKEGIYTLQLQVDDEAVKNLHDAQPTLVTIGRIVTGVINGVAKDKKQPTAIYDLQGRRIANPSNGIYVIDGKKHIIK